MTARAAGLAAGLALGMGAAPAAVAAASPAQARPVAYDIPPQPLPAAMEAFAAVTGLQVLYDRPPGAAPRSPGARGLLAPEAALRRLLAGTGFAARLDGQGGVVLYPLAAASSVPEQSPGPPPNLPRLALDALQVEGAAVVEAPRDGAVDLRFYRTLIRNGVREALSGDPKTSKDDYDAMLELEIAGDGTVQRARLAASTGDRERDRAIVDAVQGLALDQPPPVDLPHPVRVDVKSRKRP
ncbi:MAG: TonB C-terminal domain-containing protein [Caulobacteraceae bacterium]|nr:TonB C-terminal domain-containing protein [Caulobacteraceae bacterium]